MVDKNSHHIRIITLFVMNGIKTLLVPITTYGVRHKNKSINTGNKNTKFATLAIKALSTLSKYSNILGYLNVYILTTKFLKEVF